MFIQLNLILFHSSEESWGAFADSSLQYDALYCVARCSAWACDDIYCKVVGWILPGGEKIHVSDCTYSIAGGSSDITHGRAPRFAPAIWTSILIPPCKSSLGQVYEIIIVIITRELRDIPVNFRVNGFCAIFHENGTHSGSESSLTLYNCSEVTAFTLPPPPLILSLFLLLFLFSSSSLRVIRVPF